MHLKLDYLSALPSSSSSSCCCCCCSSAAASYLSLTLFLFLTFHLCSPSLVYPLLYLCASSLLLLLLPVTYSYTSSYLSLHFFPLSFLRLSSLVSRMQLSLFSFSSIIIVISSSLPSSLIYPHARLHLLHSPLFLSHYLLSFVRTLSLSILPSSHILLMTLLFSSFPVS